MVSLSTQNKIQAPYRAQEAGDDLLPAYPSCFTSCHSPSHTQLLSDTLAAPETHHPLRPLPEELFSKRDMAGLFHILVAMSLKCLQPV